MSTIQIQLFAETPYFTLVKEGGVAHLLHPCTRNLFPIPQKLNFWIGSKSVVTLISIIKHFPLFLRSNQSLSNTLHTHETLMCSLIHIPGKIITKDTLIL